MDIDPRAEEYGEIAERLFPVDEQQELRELEAAPVVAHSNDKAALRKLQDDLRKAGYKKAK